MVKVIFGQVEVRRWWVFQKRSTKFRYLGDRLFLACVGLYFLNRWVLKPSFAGKVEFFSSYINDLICFPFWLPMVLYATRKMRLRDNDDPPNFYELCFFLLLWSCVFEYLAPMYGRYLNYPVADPWDIVCYSIGCVVSGLYWNYTIGRQY